MGPGFTGRSLARAGLMRSPKRRSCRASTACRLERAHTRSCPIPVVFHFVVPELPELEALCRALGVRSAGQRIASSELTSVAAMKTYSPGLSALEGGTIRAWARRGKYLCVSVDRLWLVIHLARAGWVWWRESLPPAESRHRRQAVALTVRLIEDSSLEVSPGLEVTESGTEKRLAIWVVDEPSRVPGVAALGPDPLSHDFTKEALRIRLSSTSSNLKTALMNQSLIAGVGNTYSDEILHRAHLSPFRSADRLSADDWERLGTSLVRLLGEAVELAVGVDPSALRAHRTQHLSVHGRTGLPCPACGDLVREVSFVKGILNYCPTCQTNGRVFADRRLSRLLR